MEFLNIEHLARDDKPLDCQFPTVHAISAHNSLQVLYRDYYQKHITPEDAKARKREIRIAYESALDLHEKYMSMCKTFAEEIRVSEEFRIKLHRGLNDGQNIHELFLLACTCIAVLTGDKTLAGSRVYKQLKLTTQKEARRAEMDRQNPRIEVEITPLEQETR